MGPGKIAHKFATALAGLDNAKIHAVASRSIERANLFAEKCGIQNVHGSYEEMMSNPDLDVVYISTPHSQHYENIGMCLEYGIPVLCEKPITINSHQLEPLVQLARKKKIFLMEAIMTRFLPTIETTLDLLKSDKLGKIKAIHADFGYKAEYNPESRLFNPDLGGGCLLDIGIYPVFLCLLLLGSPDDIQAVCTKTGTGTDGSTAILFRYANGALANLYCTFEAHTETEAVIYCERGKIRINPRWSILSSLSIYIENQHVEERSFNYKLNGYNYEAEEVMRCLNNGISESPKLSLDFSLQLISVLDEIRSRCNIKYPLFETNI